jgi:antitoxin HicB
LNFPPAYEIMALAANFLGVIMSEYRYTVILEPQPEGGYTVQVPALPGCITEGDTREEALAMAEDAIAGYIACLLEDGKPVPEDVAVAFVQVVA